MDNIIDVLLGIKQELLDLQVGLAQVAKSLKEEKIENTLGDLYAALSKAQGSYKPLILNREGPGGPYADLSSIIEATRTALSSNGLSFYQEIVLQGEGGAVLLKSKLAHSSGTVIESTARVVHSPIDRETGSSYEFIKRLHACCLLGIAPSRNDPELHDDDGLSQSENATISSLKKPKEKPIDRKTVIDEPQYKMLLHELDGYPEIVSEILRFYRIDTLADMPREEYYKALDKIRRIKHNAEEYNKQAMKKG